MANATLFNPTTGQRVAVEVGSSQAQELFGKGFQVETKAPANAPEATLVKDGAKQIASTPEQAQALFAQGYSLPTSSSSTSSLEVGAKDANLDANNGADKLMSGENSNISKTSANQNADSTSLSIQQQLTALQKQMADRTASDLEATKRDKIIQQAGLTKASETSQAQLFESARVKFEVQAKYDKLQSIMSEINAEREKLNSSLNAIGDQPILGNIIRGQQANAERDANARIASLTATAALIQDDYNTAANTARDYFTATSADRAEEIKRYQNLIDASDQKLVDLSNQDRSDVLNQIKLLQDQNAQDQSEKDAKTQLMLENGTAWTKSGVTFDMSLEDIATKLGTKIEEQKQIDDMSASFKDAGITQFDSLESATRKMKASASYQKAIRESGGGGLSFSEQLALTKFTRDIEQESGKASSSFIEESLKEGSALKNLFDKDFKNNKLESSISYAKSKGVDYQTYINALQNSRGDVTIDSSTGDILEKSWWSLGGGIVIGNKFEIEAQLGSNSTDETSSSPEDFGAKPSN